MRLRVLVVAFTSAHLLGLQACHHASGPEVIVVQPADYAAAFDATLEAARQAGMPAQFVDRRGGVIQTEPRIAGSLLEPWRADNASLAQAASNTLAFQRRRARFEFTPADFQAPVPRASEWLTGPDLLSNAPLADLTHTQSPLELRVWVHFERADTVGLRRSTWSRTKTEVARIIDRDTNEVISGTHWTIVSRDREYERALLSKVAARLSAQRSQAGASARQ